LIDMPSADAAQLDSEALWAVVSHQVMAPRPGPNLSVLLVRGSDANAVQDAAGHGRDWLAQQTQWRGRANAAQANSFEALPFFIGAVVIAHQLGADQNWLDVLAALFITLRVVYVGLYVGGLANARSLVWTGAFATNIAILFIGYR
jgi:uncharacterized MAPEG superfamily protein